MSTVHYPGAHRKGSTACGYGLTGPLPLTGMRISADPSQVTCGRCKLSMTYRAGPRLREAADRPRAEEVS